MRPKFLHAIFSLVWCCLTLYSCASAPPARKPLVQWLSNPEVNYQSFKYFAILLPGSPFTPTILPFQFDFVASVVAEELKYKGYERVQDPQRADFFVDIFLNSEYRVKYIPPEQVTIPVYTPPQTIKLESQSFYYGDIQGISRGTATISIPGTWGVRSITRPGYTIGAYYPCVIITFLAGPNISKEALAPIWRGTAILASQSYDIREDGQGLVVAALRRFPDHQSGPIKKKGWLGLKTSWTEKGLEILEVEKGSPAWRARLRPGDIVKTIDGHPVEYPWQLSARIVYAGAGTTLSMTVFFQMSIKLVYLSYEPKNLQELATALKISIDTKEDIGVIRKVFPDGPGEKAGLRPGQKIVKFSRFYSGWQQYSIAIERPGELTLTLAPYPSEADLQY